MLKTMVHDPALEAARAVKAAEQKFLAMPARTVIDELTADFIAAEAQWEAADARFADAVPTSPAGALLKLRALEELQRAVPLDENSLEMRHVRALMSYLQGGPQQS